MRNEVKGDVLTYTHRLEHKLLSEYFEPLVRKNSYVHRNSTRQSNKFHLETVNGNKRLKSVSNR